MRRNKTKVLRQLLADSKLGKIKPEVTKKKTQDKILSIATIFKIWKNKVD